MPTSRPLVGGRYRPPGARGQGLWPQGAGMVLGRVASGHKAYGAVAATAVDQQGADSGAGRPSAGRSAVCTRRREIP
ncbi:hypothetical protein OF001_U20353 [Pseudomonas sp. OF001]|nr:hypothetical protein OF001_U20353 [Pseudomonas sp. OF001]